MFEPRQFKCGVLTIKDFKKSSDYSVTVDTPEDLVRTKTIFELYGNNPLQIKLKDIIDIIDSNNIENSKFKLSGNVKMPYGKEISFEEFQEDMNRRRKQSTHYSLG